MRAHATDFKCQYINKCLWDVSNDNGTFLIKGVEGSVITFSHIGYEDKKESAKNDMVVYLTKDVLN